MKTINVAIVEDETKAAEHLKTFLKQYEKEQSVCFGIQIFSDALTFLDAYHNDLDIVFMDIELPDLNGMKAAKKLRARDENVVLIFVTNMAQYALEGYSVNAYDYILKPVNYYAFSMKLARLISRLKNRETDLIEIRSEGELFSLEAKYIRKIESDGHHVIFYLFDRNYIVYNSLKEIAQKLPDYFVKCSRWCYVNMKYISTIRGDDLVLDSELIHLTRGEKKSVIRKVSDFIAGGKI